MVAAAPRSFVPQADHMRALTVGGGHVGGTENQHLVVDDQHVEGPLARTGQLRRLDEGLEGDAAGVVPHETAEPTAPLSLGEVAPTRIVAVTSAS